MSYHGCVLKNSDGNNKIITGTEKCITLTNKCMWKHPCNVSNGVKTRSKAKNKPTVGYEEVDRYFAVTYFIHQWDMGKEDCFFVK